MESNVANLTSIFMTDVQVQQNVLNGTTSNERTVDFSQYMKTSVSNLAEQSKKSNGQAENTIKEDDSRNFEEPLEKQQVVIKENSKLKETSTKNDGKIDSESGKTIQNSEELKQSLEDIKNELKQKIMDGFEITEEELEEALEVLAVNIYDLLQTDQLKELAVYISGEENLVSMITNGEMYDAYKEVAACAEELSNTMLEEFSITPEEMKEVMSQLKDMFAGTGVTEENTTLENAMLSEGKTTASEIQQTAYGDALEMTEKLTDTPEVVFQKETENVVAKVPEEQKAENEAAFTEKLGAVGEGDLTKVENSNQEQSFSETAEQNEEKEQGMLKENKEAATVQTTTTYSTVAGNQEVQTIVQTQRTDFEGIVKQIVEQIKVQIRPDTTSMELQLNPENLGKVNLHISSKEGAVTAQLFVQNEAVKTMIEGQLSVLRETMAQQGVKVEAVEVAVETGSFERNLEQHSEQQKQEAEKQAKSYQHKQVNLLAGIEEEAMSEEEILRTHIMRESGNSVDMDA